MAWSLARAAPGDGATAASLLHDLAPWVAARLADESSPPQHTAAPPQHQPRLSAAQQQRRSLDHGRAVATLCWAYGTAYASIRHRPLLDALAGGALAAAPWLTPQGLCHCAWGLARMGHADVAVLRAMGDAWVDQPRGCAPIDAATLMYALQLAGCRHERVISRVRAMVLSADATAALGADTRALPSLAWSLASLAYGASDASLPSLPATGPAGSSSSGNGDACFHDTPLWTALEALLTAAARELDPQGLAMAACAFATARHDAPAALAALSQAALPLVKARAFSPQQLSMLAFALGSAPTVAAHSPHASMRDVTRALLDAVHGARAHWHTWTERELANAAWGLAVGGLPTWSPQFVALRAELALRAGDASMGCVPHLAQLHQVEQLAAVQMQQQHGQQQQDGWIGVASSSSSVDDVASSSPGPAGDAAAAATFAASPTSRLFQSLFDMGAGRASARSTWDALVRGRASPGSWSAFQRDVAGTVMTLCASPPYAPGGPPLACEYVPSDCAQSLDVAWPDVKCAIEVDGPLHFSANTRLPLGATRLKRHLLASAGWTVASVPFYAWDRLGATQEQKQRYLRDLFVSSGIHDALLMYRQQQQMQSPQLDEPAPPATERSAAQHTSTPSARRRMDELTLALARTGSRGARGPRAALKDVLAARVARAAAGGDLPSVPRPGDTDAA